MMRLHVVGLVSGLIAACGVPSEHNSEGNDETASGTSSPRRPTQPVGSQAVALTTFSACSDLEQHLEDRAVLEMRLRVRSAKEGALWWFDWRANGGYAIDSGSASGGGSGSSSGAGGAGGSSGSSSAPADYTTTNTQHVGIDEPDIIKNDGTRLFVVSGQRLFATTTWPAANLTTRGSVQLEGRPLELFLEGDRVVVFSRFIEPSFGMPTWCGTNCLSWFSNATLVTFVDVHDLDNPLIVGTQRIPGQYESARRIGHTMRLVTSSTIGDYDGIPTSLPWDQVEQVKTRTAIEALYDALEANNERILRLRTLSDWLPSAVLTTGTTSQPEVLRCENIVSTTASARLGLTNVVTLDLDDPLRIDRQALLAHVDELYQSETSLYLSQRHWWWSWSSGNVDHTYLYQFDVRTADRARFVAAGRIDGMPLNQFSFDEHDGVLRVATTVTLTDPWRTVNRVTTLQAQGQQLVELGRTDDLAPGERIMSARFIGDLGYVVTFRNVDPLYVIDLRDPTAPRVVGELKIPGFSSYLHPLDATHLLTIGTYIPAPPSPSRERHLQLQIFDVSNPANPRQTHTELVGRAWGASWSEAQWNHKAFNYFAAKGLLAVPFSDWYSDNNGWRFSSDLRVYGVDATTGFTPKGSLDMRDVLSQRGECGYSDCWSWYWQPQVRRSVMADDYVYAVSSGGVRVARVDALNQPVATALFPPAP